MDSADIKTKAAYKRLHRFRHSGIKVLIALIILIAFVFTLSYYYGRNKEKSVASLSRTLKTAESFMSYADQWSKIIKEYDETDYRVYLSALCDTLDEDGFSDEWLAEMNSFGDYYRYFFIDGDGTLHSAASGYSCDISDEEWTGIKRDRYYDGDGWVAQIMPAAGGQLVQVYEDETDEISIEVLAECGDRIIIYNAAGDTVLYASEPGLMEGGLPEHKVIPDILLKTDTELTGESVEGGMLYPDTGSRVYDILSRSYYISEVLKDNCIVQVYEPVSVLFAESLLHTAIPFIIMILFSVIAYKTALTVRYRTKNEESAGTGLRKFTRNTFVNLPSAEYLVSILLISVLIIMLSTVYIQILSDYGSFCSESNNNLELAAASIESVGKSAEIAREEFEQDKIMQANLLADHITKQPELLDEDGLASLRELFPGCDIDIIDGDGNIIRSTGAYTGYALSSIPEDTEYICWELIKGDSSSVFYALDDGYYQAAVRRTDSIGIVRLTVPGVDLNRLLTLMTPENAILNTNFSGDMFYRSFSGPETFCRIMSSGNMAETDASLFSGGELENNCITLKRIDGRPCCVMTKTAPEFILINAIPVSDIAGSETPVLVLCLVCYLLISAVLVAGCSLYAGEEYSEDEETLREKRDILSFLPGSRKDGSGQNEAYSLLFRKLIKSVVLICLAALLVFFAVNHLFAGKSVFSFIVSGQWGKGLNIFSVSMVILMSLLAYVICAVVNWVSGQLKRFLDSGSATGVNLASSVIRVVCVGWVFFSALFQLGVDLTTIVAGLGIVTLALSVGAKDTINDLIAGIFIVLDKHVRIGDWIDVGGFYGEVIDMNIRTTKVKNGNQVISVNNSSMVNVVNRSRGQSGTMITFTVPYETDISRLKELIENSADRFIGEGNGLITSAPQFCYVEDFATYGISCAIAVSSEEQFRNSAGRLARKILKDILNENGIELAHI